MAYLFQFMATIFCNFSKICLYTLQYLHELLSSQQHTHEVLKVFLAQLMSTCLPSIASGGICAKKNSHNCLADATELSSKNAKQREVFISSLITCTFLIGMEVRAAIACRMPCSVVRASRSRKSKAANKESYFSTCTHFQNLTSFNPNFMNITLYVLSKLHFSISL